MKYEPFEPSCFYHIYNRGNNKENIFKTEENYQYFLKLVKKYLLSIGKIYSYCLLPNHFHFIIQIKDENELPDKIKNGNLGLHHPFSNLFNAYTKAINKKYQRTGSLFQEHLKRIKIENEVYLKNLIVYVNTNPAHHSIANYIDYNHSSYKSLLSKKPTLLERVEVINLFDDIENFKFLHQKKQDCIELMQELLLEN